MKGAPLGEILTAVSDAVIAALPPEAERGDKVTAWHIRAGADCAKVSSAVTRVTWKGKYARIAWMLTRSHFFTGTDWAAVVGLDPLRSPWAVWQSKVKGPTPAEIAAEMKREEAFARGAVGGLEEAMRWGNLLEEPVARETAQRLQRVFVDHGRTTLFINEDLPIPCAVSPDRIIQPFVRIPCPHGCKLSEPTGCAKCIAEHPNHGDYVCLQPERGCIFSQNNWVCARCRGTQTVNEPDDRGSGLYEGKTVGAFADPENEWSDANKGPVKHQVQLQGGLAVLQMKYGVLSGLNGAPAFNLKIHEHDRDDELIAWGLERLERLYQYIRSETPPPVDNSESTAKALARFYDRDNGQAVELPAVAAMHARELADAKALEKAAKKRKRGARNEILRLMGNAKVGTIPGVDGGIRLPTISPKPSICGSCKEIHTTREPYRRLAAFGDAQFLADEDEGVDAAGDPGAE